VHLPYAKRQEWADRRLSGFFTFFSASKPVTLDLTPVNTTPIALAVNADAPASNPAFPITNAPSHVDDNVPAKYPVAEEAMNAPDE
jgi:hypothetical protein